jgi:D-alanyl-D-alanine carboxypeptidase/D-alanyl-D-alanine-endopeptidase (penicillin-binding protein 4)
MFLARRCLVLLVGLALLLATVTPAQQTDVAAAVEALLAGPLSGAAHWGILAIDADSGQTVYSHDPGRAFLPGSNQKLLTTALALDKLGPDYRWRTSVYASRAPDRTGRVRGDVVLYGRGDPTFSNRFSRPALARVDDLAERLVAAGVRRVDGNLVCDESYFIGNRLGFGWEWNDLQWAFGAEVSALSVNDNCVDIVIRPGIRPGAPCVVETRPAMPLVKILNRTETVPLGAKQDIGIYRPDESNTFDVWGHLPMGAERSEAVSVHDPARMFGGLLAEALARRRVKIAGRVVAVDGRLRHPGQFDPARAVELAWVESAPLRDVVLAANKESVNLYAELLLRTTGRMRGAIDAPSSEEAGLAVLKDFLTAAGVDVAPLVLADGSGLSRRNLVTPAALVRLLSHVRSQAYAGVFLDSLPVGGNDGTLTRRFAGTELDGRVRAKTGTLEHVSALSGFLTARSGKQLVFSIMVNNDARNRAEIRRTIDAVVTALAEA